MEFSSNQNDFIQYPGLEKRLTDVLKPIKPNPEFVGRLKTTLGNKSAVVIERTTHTIAYLVIGAGLFSGALLMWLLRRKK